MADLQGIFSSNWFWLLVALLVKLGLFILTNLQALQKSKSSINVAYKVVQTGSHQSKKKVVVTGGCGFLGRHIVALLDERFRDVFSITVLDIAAGSVPASTLNPRVTYIRGDIAAQPHVKRTVEGAVAVIHAARAEDLATSQKPVLTAVNTTGTRTLMEASLEAEVQALVYLSSINVLWQAAAPTEATPSPSPEAPVPIEGQLLACGGTMAYGERYVLGGNGPAMRTTVLRTGWLYSRSDATPSAADATHGFVPLVSPGLASSPVPLVHVCDAARVAVAAMVCLLAPAEGAAANAGSAGPLLQAARRPWSPDATGAAAAAEGGGEGEDGSKVGDGASLSSPASRMAWVAGKVLHVVESPAGTPGGGRGPWWSGRRLVARVNEMVARRLGIAPIHRACTQVAQVAVRRGLAVSCANTDKLMGGSGWLGPASLASEQATISRKEE